jgi:methionyl-tRNA synthetase
VPRFYITTAIDYANGDPHLGHAYEKVGADVIARWRRLRGDDVWFLIGMDEHGQKVAQTAADRGLTPQALTDRVAVRFEETWRRLGISHDQFMRTTAPEHKRAVQELIELIFAKNPDDFYEKSYAGNYCVGCESFKADAEVVDGKCILHPTRKLEWVEERNWFFRLSKYQPFLEKLFAERPEFLQPESRRNEILGLLKQGLEDISASRSRFSWGVPFPRPTSDGEQQTTYVWFDALPNYWTATRFGGSKATWPAQLHVVGKDITRFHTVIWPAMLAAAGIPLPEQVWGHGFIYLGGERFSKSAGVKLELDEAIDRFGPDPFRYYLIREVPWESDGNFSWERFAELYNAELANGLGNLASRVTAMIEKFREGVVPEGSLPALEEAGVKAVAEYAARMDRLDLKGGIEIAIGLVNEANLAITTAAPWALAKDPAKGAELDQVLGGLARSLVRLALMFAPVIPGKAGELWTALGQPGALEGAKWAQAGAPEAVGRRVTKPEGLFPRPESGPNA